MVRRIVVTLAVLLGSVALVAPAAQATAGASTLNRAVSGPYSGTQTFTFGGAGCSFVNQIFEGTYETRPGRGGSFVIDTCVTLTGETFTFDGTFELRTQRKGRLTGTVAGTTDAALPDASLDLVLTVTEGTRQFRRAVGTITLVGQFRNVPPENLGSGTTEGTLTGNLERARRRR